MSDYEAIWLSPVCEDASCEGRTWSVQDEGPCEDCGAPWVKFVHADRIRELEAALREIAEFPATEPWRITAKAMQNIARAALDTQTGRVDPAPSSSGPAPTATVNRR
jgi:hypothetical protein